MGQQWKVNRLRGGEDVDGSVWRGEGGCHHTHSSRKQRSPSWPTGSLHLHHFLRPSLRSLVPPRIGPSFSQRPLASPQPPPPTTHLSSSCMKAKKIKDKPRPPQTPAWVVQSVKLQRNVLPEGSSVVLLLLAFHSSKHVFCAQSIRPEAGLGLGVWAKPNPSLRIPWTSGTAQPWVRLTLTQP